ncbi:M14 family metallopeptidase [Caldovatus aquaticus]|uniref:Succinylglutamate desuccinylase/aspartoacylase family protein n=1 Tax=Caldovatus aquaticus TaxID=2865671 RepID=A0ABS7F651_9PROT|nr:succinylglutamate desuccinylase/aspartoacylase family protein [Caldovatus aquaticus]MBW8271098.1 succinylglutamate desuccinylase/aspartoacylase family protein [Caldovatus aquaticus]
MESGQPPPAAMPQPLPCTEVRIPVPELGPWREGNTGLPGVWSFAAAAPGPHLAVVALTHGNEIAGAHLLLRWLRAGLRPVRGRLSLVFANLDAFARFDPADPTASRFLDEDMNRLWSVEQLERAVARPSSELRRARALRPVFDAADVVLDLHSMLWPSDPLILSGTTDRAARLALAIGLPPLVVADEGHAGGRRLIDYPRFADPRAKAIALLLEAGPHWEPETVETAAAAAGRLLGLLGLARPEPAEAGAAAPARPRLARVTRAVTAASAGFAFLREFRGGEVIARRNTLIALDGEEEIRTPHDDCLLVMPSPRPMRGHTAVRLARFVDAPPPARPGEPGHGP